MLLHRFSVQVKLRSVPRLLLAPTTIKHPIQISPLNQRNNITVLVVTYSTVLCISGASVQCQWDIVQGEWVRVGRCVFMLVYIDGGFVDLMSSLRELGKTAACVPGFSRNLPPAYQLDEGFL